LRHVGVYKRKIRKLETKKSEAFMENLHGDEKRIKPLDYPIEGITGR
jgi:hypothetical protein